MKSALIRDSKVVWVTEVDTSVEPYSHLTFVDITSVSPAPQEGWEYNSTSGTFRDPNQASIEDIKSQMVNIVWSNMDRIKYSAGISAGGYLFDSSQESRERYIAMNGLGSVLPEGIQWKTLSGEYVTLTPQLLQEIITAGVNMEHDLYLWCASKVAEINSATNLSSVTLSCDWPL